MSIYSQNYRESSHFAYPDLTKVIGCPTYDTLHNLKKDQSKFAFGAFRP